MASPTIEPPIPLTDEALVKWEQLTVSDEWSSTECVNLAAYCAAYGRWHEAEKWLADPDHGPVLTIRNDKNEVKSHGVAPQVTISEKALKEMERLGRILEL